MPPKIRIATPEDLPAYQDHQIRHSKESGRDGDLIFVPYEKPWDVPLEALEKDLSPRWEKKVTACGWERCWVLEDHSAIRGTLKLKHAMGLESTLHWALLSLGIERSHRGQGWGSKLMATAIDWAKAQPSLDYLRLFVFAHNPQAKALYRRFGFIEGGTTRDYFRVMGQSIDDTEMSLGLRR